MNTQEKKNYRKKDANKPKMDLLLSTKPQICTPTLFANQKKKKNYNIPKIADKNEVLWGYR